VVVSSDLPVNHDRWLAPYAEDIRVLGTCNELTHVVIAAPSYTIEELGVSSIADVRGTQGIEKTVLSYAAELCPVCRTMAESLTKKGNALEGFSSKELPLEDLKAAIQERIDNKRHFLVTWFTPTATELRFPQIRALSGSVRGENVFPGDNQGKVIARADALERMSEDARTLLGGIFVGNDGLREMDRDMSDNGVTYREAAAQWMARNERTVDMWLWGLGGCNEGAGAKTKRAADGDEADRQLRARRA